MPRVKTHIVAHARKKKIMKAVRGYRGGRSKLYRTAVETWRRALRFAFRDRRRRKREFRRLWIVRLNAAARQHGLTYRELVAGLRKGQVHINRKALAELAVTHPRDFSHLVDVARAHLSN